MSGKDKAKQSDKFKNLVGEYDTSPEIQEKIKIAFAEGYSANDRKEDPMSGWPKRAMRVVLWGVTLWLLFQIIQGYSAMGGSELTSSGSYKE